MLQPSSNTANVPTWTFQRKTIGSPVIGSGAFGYNFVDDITGAPPYAQIYWEIKSYSDSKGNSNPYPSGGIVGTTSGQGTYHNASIAPMNCAALVSCQYTIAISIPGNGSRTINFALNIDFNQWTVTAYSSSGAIATTSSSGGTVSGKSGDVWGDAISGAFPGANVTYTLDSYSDTVSPTTYYTNVGGSLGVVSPNGTLTWGGTSASTLSCNGTPPCVYYFTINVDGYGSRKMAINLN